MDNQTIAAIGGFVLFVVGYLLFKSLNKSDSGFKKYYKNILNSEEYKVKGQFEEWIVRNKKVIYSMFNAFLIAGSL